MKVVVALFFYALIFIVAYLLAKRWGESKSKLYWSAFISHLAAAIALGLVYQYYYSANDTWEFFTQAAKLADFAKKDFASYAKLLINFDWDQRPHFVTHDFRSIIFIKIASLFCLLGDSNYWICAGYFSLMSFGASWFLFRKVKEYFKESTTAAAIAFLFFPSVVFWSSGVVKETLALASIYLLAGIFLQTFYEKKINKLNLLLALLASVLLWTLKYYWAGVFFISAASAFALQFLLSKIEIKKKVVIVAAYVTVFIFIGLAVSFSHPNFYLHRFLGVLVTNHDAFVKLSSGGNLIHYYQLNASAESIIFNSPWALVSGIFRPLPGEGSGAFGVAASVENLIVLILFISFLWGLKTQPQQQIGVLTLAVLSYCIVLCIFLALSTPNLGTLSRYRVGFMPLLIFMLAYRNPLLESVIKKFSS